ncbi:MAG: NupC/NupG family nucleoside CNT transporter, partial [Candidatus Marinimicrobia bacterium CG_4_9_14_3_um_filter_48_9]
YSNLSAMLASHSTALSLKSEIIASYALCGFANFASVGIQIGGIGGIAPSRRGDLAALAFRAMFGGALASWMTASLAGLML